MRLDLNENGTPKVGFHEMLKKYDYLYNGIPRNALFGTRHCPTFIIMTTLSTYPSTKLMLFGAEMGCLEYCSSTAMVSE
jgi:hypothetical protein